MDINEEIKNKKYTDAYSETKLFEKIIKIAKASGIKLVYLALLLFYTLQKEAIPIKTKAVIIGALGYFILPGDMIPDFIVGIGHVDDLTVLLGALAVVATYVDEETKAKATSRLKMWFKNYDHEELIEIDQKIKK